MPVTLITELPAATPVVLTVTVLLPGGVTGLVPKLTTELAGLPEADRVTGSAKPENWLTLMV